MFVQYHPTIFQIMFNHRFNTISVIKTHERTLVFHQKQRHLEFREYRSALSCSQGNSTIEIKQYFL